MTTMTMARPPQSKRAPFPVNPADVGALFYATCLLSDSRWEMSHAERSILRVLLDRIRPRLAIEVGTFRGGSLSLISQYCDKVFSLDIDPSIPDRLKGIKNAQFVIGPSAVSLPALLAKLRELQLDPEFILIDADHSEAGVRGDIQSVLACPPRVRTFVLMHDSFNPGCRRGILTAGWEQHPFVHSVEVDFVTGCVVNQPASPAHGQLWGGLAFAVLDPRPRQGPLVISTSGQKTYEHCLTGR